MKLVNRETDYAIQALLFMAKTDKIITCRELKAELTMPQPFLRKIMQILTKNNILTSCKGKGGGFVLQKSPKKLFLTDIMRIFQGNFSIKECLRNRKLCPEIKICSLRRKLDSIEKLLANELEKITIYSLLYDS
ncbi:RrF2 family transcriptional regulator [Chlamydiota bacterium]